MRELCRGFLFLLSVSLLVTSTGCSHSSGNSGGPARQSTSARQSTLAALKILSSSALTVQNNILGAPKQRLIDFPALTGVLLISSIAQGLDGSPIGNASASGSLEGDPDSQALLFLVLASIARDGYDDLKKQVETLEEFRKQDPTLMTSLDVLSKDFDGVVGAITTEAQELMRKQDAGGGIDSDPFNSMGIFHISGRSDRHHTGGGEDLSHLLNYDARPGLFSTTIQCFGSSSSFFLQAIDLWSGQELARVQAIGGTASLDLTLSQRTAVGLRVIMHGLPYGYLAECSAETNYRRRLGAVSVKYSSGELGPLKDTVSDLTTASAELTDGLRTLLSDKVLSLDEVEAILDQQDLLSTVATSVLPTQGDPFGNLESIASAIGALDNWALDSQKKLEELMEKKSKPTELLTNVVAKANNARASVIGNVK